MAESTRSKSNMERIEEAIAKLATNHLNVSNKLDDLLNRVSAIEANQHNTPSHSSSSANPTPPHTPNPLPRMKLDVPRSDGTDPSGWMFKINQFFACLATPEPYRLTVLAFAMEGPALAWFQWMSRSGQISSWLGFLQALEGRFATSQYEDPTGLFSKLTQTGTVATYLSQFETLANRTIGLPNSFLLSCFVSGLIPEIRCEVQVAQPLTLTHAADLARLHEEKLADQHHANRGRFGSSVPPRSSLMPPASIIVVPSPVVPALLPPPTKPPPPPLKRLSPEEIAMHREKGLCFNCDEKFSRGHRCSSKFFLLIAEADDAAVSSNPMEVEVTNSDPDPL